MRLVTEGSEDADIVRGELEAYARQLNVPEEEIADRVDAILAVRDQVTDLKPKPLTGKVSEDYQMKADRDRVYELGAKFLGEHPDSSRALTEASATGRKVLDILFSERIAAETAENDEQAHRRIARERELERRRLEAAMRKAA